jgi:hypothetical protein
MAKVIPMQTETKPRAQRSWVARSVLVGAVGLGAAGAIWPNGIDFNVVSGAIYGFLLGAVFGVLADRRRSRAKD